MDLRKEKKHHPVAEEASNLVRKEGLISDAC